MKVHLGRVAGWVLVEVILQYVEAMCLLYMFAVVVRNIYVDFKFEPAVIFYKCGNVINVRKIAKNKNTIKISIYSNY